MTSNPPEQPRTARDAPGKAEPTVRDTTPVRTGPGGEVPALVILHAGGRPLPDYELVRKLGAGGYGEVWEARGPGGVAVALKFVRLGDRATETELRALEFMKTIHHPNLIGLSGAWQREGMLILAMELGEHTLQQRLLEAQGEGFPGIPALELLEYLRDAARGLDYLHSLHIQHRDIKPHNLLLVGGGVKVADFGLAKLLRQPAVDNSGNWTPAYAAPEFFAGQTVTQSDQYSLAVTYCQLRGGRLPFAGPRMKLLRDHMEAAPDLSMLPESERPAVARALAKDPAQRWPSCRAFVSALEPALLNRVDSALLADSTERQAPVPPPPRLSARLWALVLLLLLLPAAWVVLGWFWPRPPAGPAVTGPLAREVRNSIGMRLALIPAGSFVMGAPAGEGGREDEQLQPVVIARPFYLGVFEVTRAQYRGVMDKDPSFHRPRAGEAGDLPVENVTWEEAREFCVRLSALPAERAAGRVYRLPWEAEWEYACRGGAPARTAFAFGDSLGPDQANCDGRFPHGGAAPGPFLGRTAPVGSYKPNGFGLYDMHGNVREWCADWYGATARPDEAREAGQFRVLRGGSWADGASGCRSAARARAAPGQRNAFIGFRVLMPAPPAAVEE
jgi:formylglycine-generating enzyme required for sulfatase activity